MGDPFFCQIPSVDKWSSMSVLYQPTGYIGNNLIFFIRIYTTSYGVGRIEIDNAIVNSSNYRQIKKTDFYYYDGVVSSATHRVSSFDPNVNYSVSLLSLS